MLKVSKDVWMEFLKSVHAEKNSLKVNTHFDRNSHKGKGDIWLRTVCNLLKARAHERGAVEPLPDPRSKSDTRDTPDTPKQAEGSKQNKQLRVVETVADLAQSPTDPAQSDPDTTPKKQKSKPKAIIKWGKIKKYANATSLKMATARHESAEQAAMIAKQQLDDKEQELSKALKEAKKDLSP